MEQILIIEDDFSLNQGLCRALKQEERQLIPCPNLKTAREQLLCSDPSLVLLDINLPDGSGLDFLREIKTSSPLRPVILLTANDTDMDIVNGLVFDFERMQFWTDGTAVELSKTEQKLLRLLVENQGTTLSRSRLIDRIWTDGAEYVDENALSVTVKRLRDKLGAHDFIQTVYGIGYCWRKKNGQ